MCASESRAAREPAWPRRWAVLKGWPALLVPVDLGWGLARTAVVALAGKRAHARVPGGER